MKAPQGSTFLFLDVSHALGTQSRYHTEGGGVGKLLETCVDHGLLLAPGKAFGPYPEHLRLCFTSAPPDVVLEGVDILTHLLSST